MKKLWLFSGCAVILCGCSTMQSYDSGMPERAYAPPAEAKYGAGRKMSANNSVAMNKSSDSAFFQQSERQMAYTAGFTLVVKDKDAALDEMKKLAESYGGYLLSSNRGNMVLKVPVKKGDEFLKKSGSVGKMSDFRISAEDLTDTITDLDVRLTNLRKLRTRLTELLSKANNVADILKVERELNRITTEIERLEAQLQNNKNRVDFVTFEVAIIEEHGAIPGGTPQAVGQFPFLEKLADSCAGDEDDPLFCLDLPENFVCINYGRLQSDSFAATTSDDCVFRTWCADIPDASTLKFWETMVCRALTTLHKYDDVKCFAVKFNGKDAVKITAGQTTARGIQHYMAVISVKRCLFGDELQIIEFFGPQDAFKKHEKAVSAVIQK